jgi:hypothetical protein
MTKTQTSKQKDVTNPSKHPRTTATVPENRTTRQTKIASHVTVSSRESKEGGEKYCIQGHRQKQIVSRQRDRTLERKKTR